MPDHNQRVKRGAVAAMLASAVSLIAASGAVADTYTVTTTNDALSGDCTAAVCSLRDAVIAANDNPADDTIDVPAGTYTLSLAGRAEDASATGDLDLAGSGALTIVGAGARRTVIDAAQVDRVFDVLAGAKAHVSHLTVTGGLFADGALDGGGGVQVRGALTLSDMMVKDNVNSLDGGGVGYGGGIYVGDDGTFETPPENYGTLDIVRSTISGNTTSGEGGGLYTTGGDLTVTNSTIADNTVDTSLAPEGWGAYGGGGSIYSLNVSMTNVTITGNTITDPNGGSEGGGPGLAVGWGQYHNTIIAGNHALDGIAPDQCGMAVTTYPFSEPGPNLDDDGTCFTLATDLHADPLFGALGDHGGETDTVFIPKASPAVDAGDDSIAPSTDQRGVARPQLAGSDLGAFEYKQSDVSLTQSATPTAVTEGDHIAYTLVASASDGDATDVTVTDALPDGIILVSAAASQGDCSGTAEVTCDLGSVASGSSAVVTVLVRAEEAGTVTNTASVAAAEFDPDDADNSAATTVTVEARPADPQPPAPTAPTASTGHATLVSQHAAVLDGTVNPRGARTTYYFEYGPGTGYGARTPDLTLSGDSEQKVSAMLTALQLGSGYHYRLVARNAGGAAAGQDATLFTIGRLTPRALSVRGGGHRDLRLPYRYVLSGELSLPHGVSAADACRGRVEVHFDADPQAIPTRRVKLTPGCSWRAAITLRRDDGLRRSGRLKVRVRFAGNSSLRPRKARTVYAYFGKRR